MSYAMVDAYCASYAGPPTAVTLDIDDTVDVVHGHQQLSLFNAHHDERCFMPIHIYDIATSRPVAILLRPGKTPSGHEVSCHVRRLVRRIRSHWPTTRLTIRGDGHYGRPEVMAWYEVQATGDAVEQLGFGACGRECDTDPRRGLGNASGNLVWQSRPLSPARRAMTARPWDGRPQRRSGLG